MKAKTRKAPNSAATPPPAGLIAMMSLVREDYDGSISPGFNATRAYPLAQRVIDKLRTKHGHIDLTGAAKALYPGLDSEPDHHACGLAGFFVGVATAWLLMREIGSGR